MRNKFEWKSEIPDWALVETCEGVTWAGAPLAYRADRREGNFYVGTDCKGESIQVQIFDWRWESGLRWGRPLQTWLDVAFVDSDNVVGLVSLNKQSAINVFDFLLSLKQTNHSAVDACSLRVTLGFDAQATEEGEPYYVVRVEAWEFGSPEEWRQVAVFRDSGQMQWILAGEVE